MATLNSIDGVITSGGDNPTLGLEFPTTLYQIQLPGDAELNKLIPATFKASVTYIDEYDRVKNFNAPIASSITNTGQTYAMVLTDRIKKVLSTNNVKLTDKGLVFNIPAESTAPTFVNISEIHNKDLNAKKYKVYFGTPSNVNGSITFMEPSGTFKTLSLKGTTAEITAIKITNYSNIRLVDLNPDVVALKPVVRPVIGFQQVISIATGTYGTISSPVSSLTFLNAPIVSLVSGGTNPEIGKTFAATIYDIEFPEVGTGTIEYIDSNGKLKTYTLNKSQIFTPNGLLSDSIIQVNKLDNVKLIDKGLVYQIKTPTSANFLVPTSMPILPAKPKFYQIYFGNPVYPQGTVVYIDSKGASKMITNFGKIVTIDATNIYRFSNVKIVEMGDVI